MVDPRLLQILKEFARPREFTFGAVFEPRRFARRFRLIQGLLKDVPKGKLTKKTQKDLIAEIADTIRDSPFIKPFLEAEERRGGRLIP